MHYETFDPKIHDVYKVAKLYYDVDFRTFDMFFKDESKAIEAIAKDFKKEKTDDLFKVILDDDNDVIGMLMLYTKDTSHEIYFKSIRLVIVDILDYFVLSDIKEDDLYLAQIAIDPKMRGHGLGKKVILDVIECARFKNFKRVTIDADFRNEGARKLYERIGFKEYNKKRVKIGSFERGMYNMELIL